MIKVTSQLNKRASKHVNLINLLFVHTKLNKLENKARIKKSGHSEYTETSLSETSNYLLILIPYTFINKYLPNLQRVQ